MAPGVSVRTHAGIGGCDAGVVRAGGAVLVEVARRAAASPILGIEAWTPVAPAQLARVMRADMAARTEKALNLVRSGLLVVHPT